MLKQACLPVGRFSMNIEMIGSVVLINISANSAPLREKNAIAEPVEANHANHLIR